MRLKESAISDQNFEEAADARDKEKKLRAKRERVLEKWKKTREEKRASVDEDDMLQVVADWTGIPLNRMEAKESKKLLKLEEDLRNHIVGQDFATEVVAKALRRSRADLKDPKRPIGSFMFLGPTGVGKTHLAKILAERIFGDQDSLIQIDMSEYMEKHAVSRMIGSPPGYVGYEEGGQLTEAIRRKPYAVILFDEIEKAHPDVAQILLQILEDGRLTDSLGRKVDFRNTILIMTSNVGAHILQRNTSMGFSIGDADQDFENTKGKIMDEAKKSFKPEFLNRLTEIVIFRPLAKESMKSIVDLELDKVAGRLREKSSSWKFPMKPRNFSLKRDTTKNWEPAHFEGPSKSIWKTTWPKPFSRVTLENPSPSRSFSPKMMRRVCVLSRPRRKTRYRYLPPKKRKRIRILSLFPSSFSHYHSNPLCKEPSYFLNLIVWRTKSPVR